MISQFKSINAQLLSQHKTLLAVSGGLDSVVMAHLFKEAGWAFAIAHCNFRLRGMESDADEVFVKELANQLGVPFFTIAFDTQAIAEQQKASIQLMARQLRYDWLERIRQEQAYDFIATAHHLTDSIETVLYNFTKGCGIRGLHGIPYRNQQIIRPMLEVGRAGIAAYAEGQKIAFREDSSNASDNYQRNKIRHRVTPVLKAINPAFEKVAGETIERMKEVESLFHFAVAHFKKQLTEEKEGQLKIDWAGLIQQPASRSLLYEWLRPYGFNNDQIQQIIQHSVGTSGPRFFSPTHQLLLNRNELLVAPLPLQPHQQLEVADGQQSLQLPDGRQLLFSILPPPPNFPSEQTIALLDYPSLRFPLQLDHWQTGDAFQPLGMQGKRQKLQDFFTNHKLSRLEKDNIWLLKSKDQICWVVGMRIDERFKVRKNSKQVLQIELIEASN